MEIEVVQIRGKVVKLGFRGPAPVERGELPRREGTMKELQ